MINSKNSIKFFIILAFLFLGVVPVKGYLRPALNDPEPPSQKKVGDMLAINPAQENATPTLESVGEELSPGKAGFQTSTPGPDGNISHIVQPGDFLITIAQLYGVNLDDLLAANGLTMDSIIQPGDILVIQRGVAPVQALTSGTVMVPTATLRPSLTPKPTLTPVFTPQPTVTPTRGPNLFTRVFTGQSRLLAFALIGLLVIGIVLLVISAKRIQ